MPAALRPCRVFGHCIDLLLVVRATSFGMVSISIPTIIAAFKFITFSLPFLDEPGRALGLLSQLLGCLKVWTKEVTSLWMLAGTNMLFSTAHHGNSIETFHRLLHVLPFGLNRSAFPTCFCSRQQGWERSS